jgi:mycothiol system anti-sigma-R factor
MADCNEVLHEIYSFLDGELTVESRSVIAAHLDGCTDCLEVYDFEAELRHVISLRCREQVPERLRRRIAELLAQNPPPA